MGATEDLIRDLWADVIRAHDHSASTDRKLDKILAEETIIFAHLGRIETKLDQILALERPPKRREARKLRLLFGPIGKAMSSAILHKTDHSVTASLVPTDDAGNIVTLPSAPTWSLSAGGVVSMSVASDGMSATFAPVGAGNVVVDVVAEGDPQPGVDTLHATGDVTVLAAEATKLDLSFGPVS